MLWINGSSRLDNQKIAMKFLSILRLLVLYLFGLGMFALFGGSGCLASPAPELDHHFQEINYKAVIDDFAHLDAASQQSPENLYLTGQAYLRRYDFIGAEPFLRQCQQAGFNGLPGWDPTELLLDRIHTLKQHCPPYYAKFHYANAEIEVFGRRNQWSDTIYAVLPAYAERAYHAFGSSTPKITFYMFDKLDDYLAFFKAAAWGNSPRGYQAGTGNVGVVFFCQYLPDGRECGASDLSWRQGCVAHEYGHALCNTIYGDTYLTDVPPWINEGLADLMAKPWFQHHLDEEQIKLIGSLAKQGAQPPSYDDLCHQFYKTSSASYALDKLMILRLIGGQDISCVARILAEAKQSHGNFEQAMRVVAQRDPYGVYNDLIREYWHK